MDYIYEAQDLLLSIPYIGGEPFEKFTEKGVLYTQSKGLGHFQYMPGNFG